MRDSELTRLKALYGYAVLDTPPEPNFDRITKLAATIFELPVCTLSLADAERHWFKSRYGVTATEIPRRMSFCDVTISGDRVFVVPDATADARFSTAPIVLEAPHFRFYAGAPLVSPNGHCIGSLCVLDLEPHRDFDDKRRAILFDLARTVVELLEARSRQIELAKCTAVIAEMARRDPLTGLANRRLLHEHMEEAMAQDGEGGEIAVLYLDLDRFKEINDSFGHPVGDVLLRQVAERLEASIGPTDRLARIGGDEFAIICSGPQAATHAAALADRLVGAVSAPYEVEGRLMTVGISIGIALGAKGTARADQMFKEADRALYRAKSEGRGNYCFFDSAA
jgi:diguanylate cyclase (GGDEF)-like protein